MFVQNIIGKPVSAILPPAAASQFNEAILSSEEGGFLPDRIFSSWQKNGKITADGSWPVDSINTPVFTSEDYNSGTLAELLCQIRTLKAKYEEFEISYCLFDLFSHLGITEFNIVGSSVFSTILGRKGVENAFSRRGIPDLLQTIPPDILEEIFNVNDIDFRFYVKVPSNYTKNVITYFAMKLQNHCPYMPLHLLEDKIRSNIISEFCKSPEDASHPFAMVSVGECDLFFCEKEPERSYLYFHDAIKFRYHLKQKTSLFECEGGENTGWNSLLLYFMRVLKTDRIENINFQGVISIFSQYAKGKKPLHHDFERHFLARFRHFLNLMSDDKAKRALLKSVENHFSCNPGATVAYALNMAFLLEEFGLEDLIPKSVKILLFSRSEKLLQPSSSTPFLKLLHEISELSYNNPVDGTEDQYFPLSSFLQLFSHLSLFQKVQKRSSAQVEVFTRTYGKRDVFLMQLQSENLPFYLVVSNDLTSAIKKIKTHDLLKPGQHGIVDRLHVMLGYFLPLPGANSLFQLNPTYSHDESISMGKLEDEALEMLEVASPFFQQLGFSVLCFTGIAGKTSRYFSTLIKALPILLSQEKSEKIRQQLLGHFIQYALRIEAGNCLWSSSKEIETFYLLIGQNALSEQEILKAFILSFGLIDHADAAASVCFCWQKSCLINSTLDADLGFQLLKILPAKYLSQFLRVFKKILKLEQVSYQKISPLFFSVYDLCQTDQEILPGLSKVAKYLLNRCSQQIHLTDRDKFFDLSKRVLELFPEAGYEIVSIMESKKVYPEAFRTIFFNKNASASSDVDGSAKAKLLLFWHQKKSIEQPVEFLEVGALEEKIYFLLEGYAKNLPQELSVELALSIAEYLRELDRRGNFISESLKAKLMVNSQWIYACVAGVSKADPIFSASLLRALNKWECCNFLNVEQKELLSKHLKLLLQEKKNVDLVFDLSALLNEGPTKIALYRKLAGLNIDADDFVRAHFCFQKSYQPNQAVSEFWGKLILHCSEGLFKTELFNEVEALWDTYLTTNFPILLQGVIPHLAALFLVMREKDPSRNKYLLDEKLFSPEIVANYKTQICNLYFQEAKRDLSIEKTERALSYFAELIEWPKINARWGDAIMDYSIDLMTALMFQHKSIDLYSKWMQKMMQKFPLELDCYQSFVDILSSLNSSLTHWSGLVHEELADSLDYAYLFPHAEQFAPSEGERSPDQFYTFVAKITEKMISQDPENDKERFLIDAYSFIHTTFLGAMSPELFNQRNVLSDFVSRLPQFYTTERREVVKSGQKPSANVSKKAIADYRHQKMKAFPQEICDFTWLREVDLSENSLTQVPSQINRLTQLRKLDLSSNELCEVSNEIFDLESLEYLDVSANMIEELSPRIGNLKNLRMLLCSDNELCALPTEIGSLTALKILNVQSNLLSALPAEICHLTKLKVLKLGLNQLVLLPGEISNLTNLLELELYENRLIEVHPQIGCLKQLEILYLSGNQLCELPPEIGSLTQLLVLDVAYNQLKELPVEIGHLTRLVKFIFQD